MPLTRASGAGQNLVFFSDLHWNGRRKRRAKALIQAINAEKPEWIVFGGDLIRYLSDLPEALRILSRLRARRGKLAVLGNRERVHLWRRHDFWITEYAKAGFTCLINEPCVPAGGENPVFFGLDDMRHGKPDLNGCRPLLQSGRTLVLIGHTPDVVRLFGADNFSGHIALSGHTHGGQLRLPLFGPLYTSSIYGRQFDRGWLTRADGVRLFVTTGAGETGHSLLRHRMYCPPEVVVFRFVYHAALTTVRINSPESDRKAESMEPHEEKSDIAPQT